MDNSYYTTLEEKTMGFIETMEKYLLHAPRHQRECICRRIREVELDIMCDISDVMTLKYKKSAVTALNRDHARLRTLVNLYNRHGYFDYHNQRKSYNPDRALRRFTNASFMINEIGAMIGGIIKAVFAAEPEKAARA